MNAAAGRAAVDRDGRHRRDWPDVPAPSFASRRRPGILQIVGTLTPGGAEHLVVEMCKRLSEFTQTVCCLDDEGEWAAELHASDIEVVALRRRSGFRPELGRRIARIAAERRIELLHCHQYSPFVYGRIAKYWNPKLKFVYTEHGRQSDGPPPWKRCLANPFLSRVDGAIVAVSEELRGYMIAARFPRGRVQVIRNGIDIGPLRTHADRRRARRMLGLDDSTFVAATVARLDPVKDLGTLLDAFALVRRQVPRSRLVVVGTGAEYQRLAVRAARPDLAGAVLFTGFSSNVPALLPAADVYINSSITEGVSLTILEAMAAGVAVVATAVGGTPEVIPNGAGVLVPGRDPGRLAAAVTALAVDEPRRAALAARGRAHVEAHFRIERMTDEYARMYRRLLG